MSSCELAPLTQRQSTGKKCELVIEWEKKHHAAYMREYRKTHPDYRARQKINFQRWLDKNPEYIYEYNRKWRNHYPEKVSQTRARYVEAHPDYKEREKADFKKFCENHPNYIYEHNKKWRKEHPKKVLQQLRNYRRRHPEKRQEQRARYAENHPDRKSARNKARLVTVQRCASCGSEKQIERHHPDYSQPLTIVPLCHHCHVIEHREG